jgi:hypothetical protein
MYLMTSNKQIDDSKKKKSGLISVLVIVSTILSWLTLPYFFPYGIVPFGFFFILSLILLVRKKFVIVATLICLSPYIILSIYSACNAAYGYCAGTATLMGVGRPTLRSKSLDRDYRYYRSSSGCMVWGFELFTHLPNNLQLMAMSKLLGPMRGVYSGYYPTKSEAINLLSKEDTSQFLFSPDFLYSPDDYEYDIIPPIIMGLIKSDRQIADTICLLHTRMDHHHTNHNNSTSRNVKTIKLGFRDLNSSAILIGNEYEQILYDIKNKKVIAYYT